ncbi:hypothetical protein AK812_SmicGene37737 [Symbiodinium microadriaticum]|uniref:Uncharacterized protein n=1 Tax=Symbiodinium microadriaticum TaxID=2951 RepID=A0A1Q9CFJ0_SYMMI|nr:hypothetical protein AK812_SmicGene37737 [Symbiodinium microadriaticum]
MSWLAKLLVAVDKKYRREIATRNAAKAAAAGTSKAKANASAAAADSGAEHARTADSRRLAIGNDAEVETLAKMLIQALPLAELEHEFKEQLRTDNATTRGQATQAGERNKDFDVEKARRLGESWLVGIVRPEASLVRGGAASHGKWLLDSRRAATGGGGPSQDMPANEPVEVITTAERRGAIFITSIIFMIRARILPQVAALSQRLPELQQQADKILVGMKALIAQQEALVADVVKLRGTVRVKSLVRV